MDNFSNAVSCLVGGIVIGGASSLMLRFTGQITGISGILRGAAFTSRPSPWKSAFISGMSTAGLMAGAVAKQQFFGSSLIAQGFSPLALLGSGYLVGLGTTIGSGCTSGHGVCGLPRYSQRSMVAVGTFFSTGVLTQSLISANSSIKEFVQPGVEKFHAIEKVLAEVSSFAHSSTMTIEGVDVPIIGLTLATAFGLNALRRSVQLSHEEEKDNPSEDNTIAPIVFSYLAGGLFSVGLLVSSMSNPYAVVSFLDIFNYSGHFNPCLMLVFGGAVGFNLLAFPKILAMKKPFLSSKFKVPTLKDITSSLVIGSALFGIGWGTIGLCPGPGVVGLAGGLDVLLWFIGLSMGNLSAPLVQRAPLKTPTRTMKTP